MRHDAKASPAEAIRSAGTVLGTAGCRGTTPASPAVFGGSGAPAGRRLASLFGLLAFFALSLGVAATPASATFLHSQNSSVAFGPDGTNNITVENSFYERSNADMAVDSERQRLYIVHDQNPNNNQGVSYPGAPRGLYAFDVSDPSHPQPIGGNFPLAIPEQRSNDDQIAIDPNDGTIYMLERSKECICEPGSNLYSWTPEGKSRPGYPTHIDKYGPLAIDPEGYLWVWREQSVPLVEHEKINKYLPDGTLVAEIDPGINNYPNVTEPPHDLAFDQGTGDLWLEYQRSYVRFTAASDYSYHAPPVRSNYYQSEEGFAVDGSNGVLYGVASLSFTSYIEATNEQGEPAEDPFALGGYGEFNYEKCQGYCQPEVPETKIEAMAFDESTGNIWVINNGLSRGGFNEEELAKGGRVEGYFGIGAADARTGPAIATGKTDATVTANVGPGEGPAVTACQIQYVDDDSFQKVRILSTGGATGGQFRFHNGSKWLPYNATAFEVAHSFESGVPNVTGPAGGPWRIEATSPSDFGRMGEKVSILGNELKPAGTRIHVDWDASTAECEPDASVGSPFSTPTDVEAQITGLNPGTTYHFRAIATSAAGTVYGGEESFNTTFSTVKTGPATDVDRESATLNGTVDPENLTTTYYFEYGPNPNYGSTTAAPPGDDLGTTSPGDQPVSEPIAGLEPGVTYHYRLVAVNSNGTSKGVDRTFTTVAAVRDVETEPATGVQRAQAMLHGKLDPDGLETHYYFEWGTSRRYGERSAAAPGTNLADTSPGDQEVSFLATGLTAGTTYHYRLVAISSYGTTYGNDRRFTTPTAVKGLVTEPATEVKTEEATLNGKLDPDGIATTYYFEYGKTTAYGQIAPAPPGNSMVDTSAGSKPVSYVLKGLEPGVTYHYRIVGVNDTGMTIDGDQVFTTKHPPAIEGVSSNNVTATSAELKGRVNPHGFATEWFFEYGPTIELGSVAPAEPGELAGEVGGQPVFITLTGLENRTYFFRLVAKSEWGTVRSEIQTFEFAPPSCPNSAIRQQTGANYLPDCRAYELVTPARAGGAPILPLAPFSALAGDHVGFSSIFNAIPGTEPPNSGRVTPHTDFYVARRGVDGWQTDYVGIKGNETLESREILWRDESAASSGIPADERLEHFLTWENRPPCCGDTGSYSPFMYDAQGNLLDRLPTNADQEDLTLGASEGGFRGDGLLSGDGRHYVFSSVRKAFSADGLTVAPGSAYDNDVESGEVTKISFNEAGEDIEQDPLANVGGTTGEEFIKFEAVSSNASHVLMTVAGPNDPCSPCTTAHETVHLYMHVRGQGTYDVSSDQGGVDRSVHYSGIAKGGSQVFFTSVRQMTADDEDQSVDLFRWDEATNSLTRLSTGAGESGNSDGCAGSWTSHCNVEVVPISHTCSGTNAEVRECGDSVIARDTGEIYFYSPEQLDGAKGVAGTRNLYVWRDGQPRFVASLESGRPSQRMNVSFDGSFMALVTRSQITAYENDDHSEMYRFAADDRSIACVSCRPDGDPPTSDVVASINGYFMTTDGRTFFSTEEPLVDRDANGLMDTYEYTDGRPQLISNAADTSTGSEIAPIGLIGVTADGQNAFFSTYQTLVGQDENGSFYKIYDARVYGGFEYQRPPAPCAAADECHGQGNPAPAPPVIGSSAHLGQRGNYTGTKKARKRHRAKRHHHRKRHKRHVRHRRERAGAVDSARRGQKGAGR